MSNARLLAGIQMNPDGRISDSQISDLSVQKLSGQLNYDNIPSGTIVSYFKQVDSTNRSYGTGWADGMTWDNFIKPANTKILFMSTIPMRNDSTSWGGAYTEVNFSINNGTTWESLGDTGYDVVMEYGQSINHWNAAQLIDHPSIVASTQVRFKFRHHSYDGTMTIRTSNGISNGPNYSFGDTQLTLLAIKV